MCKKRNVPVLVLLALGSVYGRGASSPPSHTFFRVQAAGSLQAPLNGRLLIFVAKGSGDKAVDIHQLHPEATWVAAKEASLSGGDGQALRITSQGKRIRSRLARLRGFLER